MTWKSIGGNLGQCYVTQFIDDEEFHTRPASQHRAHAMLALCFDQLVDHRGGSNDANSPSLRAAVSPEKIHRLIAELEVAGFICGGRRGGSRSRAGGGSQEGSEGKVTSLDVVKLAGQPSRLAHAGQVP
jgi:hypothetical protein